MQSWRHPGDYRNLPEWNLLANASRQIKETSANLKLSEDREWLRFVLGEVADQMVSTIRWAEDIAQRTVGDAPDEYAVYIVPYDAARSDVVVATYCLDFMLAEGLVDQASGTELRDSLKDLQKSLETLLQSLREGGLQTSSFSNN
jgi:hypothetical protein